MPQPLLEAGGSVKTCGQVQALRGADFTVRPGEVAALTVARFRCRTDCNS